MKRTIQWLMVSMLAVGLTGNAVAKSVKKNAPSKKEVEHILKGLGKEQYPSRMKLYKVGSVKTGNTYYHVFYGLLKSGQYRIFFFDNNKKYLGYYVSEYEPSDYEEGAVLLDSGDGETFYKLPVPETGPQKTVPMEDGMPLKFVPAPGVELKKAAAGSAKKSSMNSKGEKEQGFKPEFRLWRIKRGNKEFKVRAMYVKYEHGKVYLKAEANGVVKPFPFSWLSREDQKYVLEAKKKLGE